MLIENNITKISKDYIDEVNSIITELTLNKLNVDLEKPMVLVEYISKKYNAIGEPLEKGSLLNKTVNFNPISIDKKYAVNSTLVNATTGEVYGELTKSGTQVRDIISKNIIGNYDHSTKTLYIINPLYTGIEGDTEPQYLSNHIVEGEANFVINIVQTGIISINTLIISMFDRLVNNNQV